MARSKYTFEKRQREKARRLKQIEKASKRMMAKKQKDPVDSEIPQDTSDEADPESGSQLRSESENPAAPDEDAPNNASR